MTLVGTAHVSIATGMGDDICIKPDAVIIVHPNRLLQLTEHHYIDTHSR